MKSKLVIAAGQARRFARLGLAPAALALAVAFPPAPLQAASQHAAAAVGERHVTVTAPDGVADALLFTPPGKRARPAVILWADIGGLRPAISEVGRKLAAAGYVVLAPNAFYRTVKLDGTAVSDVPIRTRFGDWRKPTTKETIGRDAQAYAAFLDGLPQVNRKAKMGVVGFDVGSAYAFDAAQALPDRIAAVAVFYPMGTATPHDDSPHLFVRESKAAYYVAIAADDDKREPEDKGQYRDEFAKAHLAGQVDVIDAKHGFSMPDSAAHDAAADAGTWAAMLKLFRARLR